MDYDQIKEALKDMIRNGDISFKLNCNRTGTTTNSIYGTEFITSINSISLKIFIDDQEIINVTPSNQ